MLHPTSLTSGEEGEHCTGGGGGVGHVIGHVIFFLHYFLTLTVQSLELVVPSSSNSSFSTSQKAHPYHPVATAVVAKTLADQTSKILVRDAKDMYMYYQNYPFLSSVF